MSVYPNLTREMRDNKVSTETLASFLGLKKGALYRRLRGETEWKLSEVVQICEYFNNYDAGQLFLRLYTKT